MNDSENTPPEKPDAVSIPERTKPPHRILVVDDDVSIRQLSTEVLIHHGYRVDAADDGAAGWEALLARQYDLLITDNSMPKVTGVELVKRLRGRDPTLPVIMASGTAPTEELTKNPWMDVSVVLLKPYTIADLLGTVREVLRAADGIRQKVVPPDRQSQPSAGGLQR